MFLIHRKREMDASRQGFNWNVDEYTAFQLILFVWRLHWYFRIRRKKAFGEFTKQCPRFIFDFTIHDVYKDGFRRLSKRLDFWEHFEYAMFRVGDQLYKFEELPDVYIAELAKLSPTTSRYQKRLSLGRV